MNNKCLAVGIILLFIGVAVAPNINAHIGTVFPNSISFPENHKKINSNEIDSSNPKFSYDAYGHHKVNSHYADKIKTDSNQKFYNNSYSSYNNKIFKSTETSHIIYVPDDYPTIQQAIDAALPNDTIIIRDGIYTGNIVVNKPLTIQSEHGYSNCAIKEQNSNQDIVKITSDFVSIIGCYILGSEQGLNSGISHYHVNHTSIIGDRFAKIYYSIRAECSNDNTFHDNLIGSSGLESWGIWEQYTSNNTIYDNQISNLEYEAVPIHLYNASNTTVYDNAITGSYDMGLLYSNTCRIYNNSMGWSMWETIHIEHSCFNVISNNTCHSGDYDGIALWQSDNNTFTNNTCNSGIALYESHHNIFKNNMVNNKALVVLEDVNDYTITEDAGQIILLGCNNISVSHQDLSNINRGLEMDESNRCHISDSTFIGNNYQGIAATYSDDNVFKNLTVASSMDSGILLNYCNRTEICFCVLKYSWYNLYIADSSYSYIHNNSLPGHDQYGIEMISSNFNIISFNNISNYINGFTAFEMGNSENNTIFQNNFTNSCHVNLKGNNNSINNNKFKDNYWAPRVEGSNNKVFRNIFDNNLLYVAGKNVIKENNFIKCFAQFSGFHNSWIHNYWQRPRFLPYPIFGDYISMRIFLWINFDWHPAQKPYDISGTR